MNELSSIITFCAWFGTISLCVVLIVWGIYKWLYGKTQKLNIMAWIAFIILCIMFVNSYKINEEDVLRISKTVIKILLMGSVALLIILLLLIVILCIITSFKIIWKAKTESSAIFDAIKTPVVILVIAWGIIALFFIFPFLIGEKSNGIIEIWQDGVYKITSLFSTKNNVPDSPLKTTASYSLIYVIVLGVSFAIVKILRSIIGHTLQEAKRKNLIDEYSSPIALLAVGVAMLWTLKGEQFDKIGNLLKSFCTVIFIFAVIVLTLEIIRLLINMRENFIRLEARYLFILLVGQSALLILGALNFIYGTINNTIGSTEDTKIMQTEIKLKNKIVDTMNQVIDNKKKLPNGEQKEKDKRKLTFWPFDEKVTKK